MKAVRYKLDEAKRKLGTLARAVRGNPRRAGIGGGDEPCLFLQDLASFKLQGDAVKLTVEEAKADWHAVTHAAMLYGTRFVITVLGESAAILYRNDYEKHPALKYADKGSWRTR